MGEEKTKLVSRTNSQLLFYKEKKFSYFGRYRNIPYWIIDFIFLFFAILSYPFAFVFILKWTKPFLQWKWLWTIQRENIKSKKSSSTCSTNWVCLLWQLVWSEDHMKIGSFSIPLFLLQKSMSSGAPCFLPIFSMHWLNSTYKKSH